MRSASEEPARATIGARVVHPGVPSPASLPTRWPSGAAELAALLTPTITHGVPTAVRGGHAVTPGYPEPEASGAFRQDSPQERHEHGGRSPALDADGVLDELERRLDLEYFRTYGSGTL
jgi:hypothetical protein